MNTRSSTHDVHEGIPRQIPSKQELPRELSHLIPAEWEFLRNSQPLNSNKHAISIKSLYPSIIDLDDQARVEMWTFPASRELHAHNDEQEDQQWESSSLLSQLHDWWDDFIKCTSSDDIR